MIIPLFAIVLLPSLGIMLLPRDALTSFYSPDFAENSLVALAIMALVVLALDAIVLTAALRRFQRARLIAS